MTAVGDAASAHQALRDEARDGVPDIVVSDIGLPNEDGLQFLRRVRTRSSVPAIALTAYARDKDVREALDAGFQRHVAKPVEPHALATAILEVLSPPAHLARRDGTESAR